MNGNDTVSVAQFTIVDWLILLAINILSHNLISYYEWDGNVWLMLKVGKP